MLKFLRSAFAEIWRRLNASPRESSTAGLGFFGSLVSPRDGKR